MSGSADGISVQNESSAAVSPDRLHRLAAFLLADLGLDPACEVSILLVDEPRMEELHLDWMSEPGATDVLSFPMDELRIPAAGEPAPLGMVGDIVLCPAFAARQAPERGRDLEDELAFLVVHGTLHCLGFDHAEDDDRARMWALQDDLLARWLVTEEAA